MKPRELWSSVLRRVLTGGDDGRSGRWRGSGRIRGPPAAGSSFRSGRTDSRETVSGFPVARSASGVAIGAVGSSLAAGTGPDTGSGAGTGRGSGSGRGAVIGVRQLGQGPLIPASDTGTVSRVWQCGQEKVKVSEAIGGGSCRERYRTGPVASTVRWPALSQRVSYSFGLPPEASPR